MFDCVLKPVLLLFADALRASVQEADGGLLQALTERKVLVLMAAMLHVPAIHAATLATPQNAATAEAFILQPLLTGWVQSHW